MLLHSGSARCVNKHFTIKKDDKDEEKVISFVAKRLATGSILNESDAFGSVGIDFFGDIYAEKDGLKCLAIENPDKCLDAFEL